MLYRILSMLGIMITISMIVSGVSADGNDPIQTRSEVPDDGTVLVGIYALSLGNYDFIKGTYTLDFYLVLKWTGDIEPYSFEFLNGRPVSKEKIYESLTPEGNETWYRIQANLFVDPQFNDYPFGEQDLLVVMEDSKNTVTDLVYMTDWSVSGIDPKLRTSGWKVEKCDMETGTHLYPWGEEYSQTVFRISMVRQMGTTVVKTFLPPMIFCIVAGLAFFFKADKITHRLGLGTSMLISAVMFHLSQTSSLPALPYLILMDKVMIGVYVFISMSLLASTLIYIDDEYWKDVDYTGRVNKWGSAATFVVPLIVLGILLL